MKAVINGVEVEGTPEEIMEYKLLDEMDRQRKMINGLMMGVPIHISYQCMCMDEDD